MRLHSDDFEVSEDSNTREFERSEMGGGDPAGSAGGAGGKAPRGITLGPVASALAEAAALVWPDLDDTLARHAATGARPVPATPHPPAAAMLSRIAAALGA